MCAQKECKSNTPVCKILCDAGDFGRLNALKYIITQFILSPSVKGPGLQNFHSISHNLQLIIQGVNYS